MSKIGDLIRTRRQNMEMSQKSLALLADISYSDLIKIEGGCNEKISLETIDKLCRALDIDFEEGSKFKEQTTSEYIWWTTPDDNLEVPEFELKIEKQIFTIWPIGDKKAITIDGDHCIFTPDRSKIEIYGSDNWIKASFNMNNIIGFLITNREGE